MLKQYVVVPRKPKMSKGKIASQVAHATFMALEKQRNQKAEVIDDLIEDWKNTGMCVIVLECDTQQELYGLKEYCEEWEVKNHLYIDEGYTEIPMGTATAFSTGVLTEDEQLMFQTMKLFKTRWYE